MQAASLTAYELFCRKGDRWLFEGIDLHLSAGEALHLKGPNGVGKTSLIRILAGLLPPTQGTVTAEGSIAMLDERPALDTHQPLGKALAFWAAIDGHGAPADQLGHERLGLAHLLEVPVRYLSTGQKKRAALARLLGQQAAIWLLDEPLNGLDTAGAALVETLIAQHRAAGGIVVTASHQAIAVPGSAILDLAA